MNGGFSEVYRHFARSGSETSGFSRDWSIQVQFLSEFRVLPLATALELWRDYVQSI